MAVAEAVAADEEEARGPHPTEFRRRAPNLVRPGYKPVAVIAKDLGISESCLRIWMAADDVDAAAREGPTPAERAEPVRWRRENRGQAMDLDWIEGSTTPSAATQAWTTWPYRP